jgi:flagellin
VNSFATFPYVLPTERPELSYSTQTQTQFIHVAPRDFILQIGPNQGQQMRTFIADLSAEAMGVRGILLVSEDLAQEAITAVDEAIARVNGQRSALGAIQNRLEATIRNLDVASENLTASESRIRDADIALETLTATRLQILLQAGTAALAQANQLPQAVLQLLR